MFEEATPSWRASRADSRLRDASPPTTSLYELLEISPRASQEVIQAAYRVLARRFHPDVNPSPGAARRMLQVNAAYQVLSDPRRRAHYDLDCARAQRRTRATSAPHRGGPIARDRARHIPTPATLRASHVARPESAPAVSIRVVLLAALIGALVALVTILVLVGLDGNESQHPVLADTQAATSPRYVMLAIRPD